MHKIHDLPLPSFLLFDETEIHLLQEKAAEQRWKGSVTATGLDCWSSQKKKKKAKSWLTGLFFHIYLNCNPTQSHSHHTFILNKSSSKIKMITSQCWEGESQDAFLTSSHWLLPEKCRPWVGSLLFPDTEALVNRATFSPGMAFTACLSTHPSICPQLFWLRK